MSDPLPTVDDLKGILISSQVNEKQDLFILLAADGSINRIGTGEPLSSNGDMFIGVTSDKAFRALASKVDLEWFNHAGQRFELPDPRGAPGVLRLIFKTDVKEYPFEFLYGLESGGVPSDIGSFVNAAIEVTEPWYQAQKRMVESAGKPWWKFW